MSTLEKAIGLLQEMPENKLEAVYMYMRFVNSQTDSDETAPALNVEMDSHEGMSYEYISSSSTESKSNTVIAAQNNIEERQRAFQGLMSYAGTLPKDFDYKQELEEAREEKYARFI